MMYEAHCSDPFRDTYRKDSVATDNTQQRKTL